MEIAENGLNDPRARIGAAKALLDMEKRNLAEDLNDDKNRRLDAGKSTDAVMLIVDV